MNMCRHGLQKGKTMSNKLTKIAENDAYHLGIKSITAIIKDNYSQYCDEQSHDGGCDPVIRTVPVTSEDFHGKWDRWALSRSMRAGRGR